MEEGMADEKKDTIEYIGKVKLDLSEYPGEDFYSDGAVEDELLTIARDCSKVEYDRIIGERKNWPILYHLSPLRANIIEWLPMDENTKVLEVGSGCGAITGMLAAKAGSVTCVELSKRRSSINANRNADCENITIHVGNFKDVEPKLDKDYDYILLIGVLEYALSYMGGERPYEDFLKILAPHLKADGRMVIAIENKYGLKYFAGCKEDHLNSYFSGIENYNAGGGVRTFGRKGLEKLFDSCGLSNKQFFYPYPDYKFMTTLFSDDKLPGKGELCDNLRNFDGDRMQLFDEKNAYDGLCEEGLFPVFSNSYLVVLGPKVETAYVKYSNDRAPQYSIKTQIDLVSDDVADESDIQAADNNLCEADIPSSGKTKFVVGKYPMAPEAEEHVRGMEAAYESLSEKYKESELSINHCRLVEEPKLYAEFEYVEGTPLVELLDRCLEKDDLEGFQKLFREFVKRIDHNPDFPVVDFDMIFGNILVNGDEWNVIDYEWTFGKTLPVSEIAFRAIYYYLYEDEKRNKLPFDWILEELGITQTKADELWEQEKDFQNFIRGDHTSMAQMRDLIGNRVMEPLRWIDKYKDSREVNRVQIYEDTGNGHNEEQSYFVREAYQGDNLIEIDINVSGDVKMLRIDPAGDCCMVKITEMLLNGERVPLEKKKVLLVNGRIVKPADKDADVYQPSLVFPTTDPNININMEELNRLPENKLYARMEIVRIPMEIAKDMAANVKKLI